MDEELNERLAKGIQEAREGRTIDLGDFSRWLEDEEDESDEAR